MGTFFALHRPISITDPLPSPSPENALDSIFSPEKQKNTGPAEVMFTLSNVVDMLDSASSQRTNATPPGVIRLDGSKTSGAINLDKLVSQCKPYKVPPPPVPFDEMEAAAKLEKEKAGREKQQRSPRRAKQDGGQVQQSDNGQQVWETTIRLRGTTDQNGATTITAETTPMVEIAPYSQQEPPARRPAKYRQPFLERMRIRHVRWMQYRDSRLGTQRKMFLISVKRQRRLKMKKHKYKKLLKKTRNLRRKLEKR